MQWTDRIRQVKIVLVVAAVVIAVASLVVSNTLVRDLAAEERGKIEVWAEAMRALSMADEATDLNLVLKVLNENHSIPVIVLGADGEAQTCRNIDFGGMSAADSVAYLAEFAGRLHDEGQYIRISIGDDTGAGHIDVCYGDSLMLRRLSVYPYIQLGVVLLFVVVALFALLTSKKAEQNKVWVGLSKETAHQLGTPVSSLMAWIEMLKETYPGDATLPEMEKDVSRLQLIAERFSKIGSRPEPVPSCLNDVIEHAADYMDRRTSRKVAIIRELPEHEIILPINAPLFEWVIENLCKNAVDAMNGDGTITISVKERAEKVIVDVSDTGKGIRKKDVGSVFKPGFTTKKRGWGLGLSLAKRIVEEYHRGRIFVKRTEIDKGTTFRIEIPRRTEWHGHGVAPLWKRLVSALGGRG